MTCSPRLHGRRAAIVGLGLLALLPAPVRAAELAAASSYETPPRKGFYAEMSVRPGGVAVRDDVVHGRQARAKLEAGAKLVQLYSGLVYRGPALVRESVTETRDFA